MGRIIKRLLALLIAGVLTAGCLAGCSLKKNAQENEEKSRAMGRYLETEIPLPPVATEVYDVIQTDEGNILIAAANDGGIPIVYRLSNDETSWEEVYRLNTWAHRDDSTDIPSWVSVALSSDGSAAVSLSFIKKDDVQLEQVKTKYFWLDNTGEVTVVPYESSSSNEGIHYSVADENIYIQENDFSIKRLNPDNGETEIVVDKEQYSVIFGIAGDTLYSISAKNQLTAYSLESGEPLPQDVALEEAVKQSGVSVRDKDKPIILEGSSDDKDTMFFCTQQGLFRHMKDGSVTEKVIDGGLTSMYQPELGFVSMDINENIWLLLNDENDYKLFKYTYSEDTPTVPPEHIKAYTLYENPEIIHAISMYQKENPEVYVEVEIGVTEQSSVTVSDALRNLATEIMAGSGPDLLILDGLPIESYMEKGLLEDISDIIEMVDQKEGLFTNITSAFEQKNNIFAVPLRFYMLVLEGQQESLKRIIDLNSLADEAERLHKENPDKIMMNVWGMSGVELASYLYDVCSAAWLQTDGAIDQVQLEEFYTQLKRLYSIDDHSEEENTDKQAYRQCSGSIGENTVPLHNDVININFGRICSFSELKQITTTVKEKPEIGYDLLNGQTKNTFTPSCIAGINSKGEKKDLSRDFLRFLLSETAQAQCQGYGMPVNRKGIKNLHMNEGGEEYGLGSLYVDASENSRQIMMLIQAFTEEDYADYLKKVERLENPSLGSEIIRQAVMEQVNDCVEGSISPKEAAERVVDKINLYLAEG